jgi:hypothetical protein
VVSQEVQLTAKMLTNQRKSSSAAILLISLDCGIDGWDEDDGKGMRNEEIVHDCRLLLYTVHGLV